MATQKPRLTYTNSRGLGEKIRLMLCICEIPFEDVALRKRSEFLRMIDDGKLLFKQMPVLEYNGLTAVQSSAIMRYLAAKHGMYPGANPEEQLRIDMMYDACQDFVIHFVNFAFYGPAEDSLRDGKQAMDKYCPIFEKELANNKTGFLVGKSMTLADVALFDVTQELEEHYGQDELKKYPNIWALHEKMKNDKRIQHYTKTYRYPAFTPETVKEVKELFDIP